jgi:hypothetical protein
MPLFPTFGQESIKLLPCPQQTALDDVLSVAIFLGDVLDRHASLFNHLKTLLADSHPVAFVSPSPACPSGVQVAIFALVDDISAKEGAKP